MVWAQIHLECNWWQPQTRVSSIASELAISLKCFFVKVTPNQSTVFGLCPEFLTDLSHLVATALFVFGIQMITQLSHVVLHNQMLDSLRATTASNHFVPFSLMKWFLVVGLTVWFVPIESIIANYYGKLLMHIMEESLHFFSLQTASSFAQVVCKEKFVFGKLDQENLFHTWKNTQAKLPACICSLMTCIFCPVLVIAQSSAGTWKPKSVCPPKHKEWVVLTPSAFPQTMQTNIFLLAKKERLRTGTWERLTKRWFWKAVPSKENPMSFAPCLLVITTSTSLLVEVLE